LVVFTGEAGNQKTPNLPPTHGARVIAYRLNASETAMNDTSGQPQVKVASAGGAKTESENAPSTVGSGTIPYTPDQVAAGRKVYQAQCSSCHGAQLQGVSAPALGGPQFAHSNLNVSQIYAVVTKQMPLNAPGSLSQDDYASVMAYIMKHDCVKSSGNGQKFPSTNLPVLSKVTVGSQVCP
jgi:mono/diheme cytochrome c family protein